MSSRGEMLDAPAGPAIFGPPYVYFPATRILVRWRDSQLEPVNFEPGGEVLALRATAGGFDYAVRRDGEVWIEHYSVADESHAVAGWIGPANAVLLLEFGVLIATDHEVHLNQAVFDLEGVTEFLRMGDSAVEAVTANRRWVIDLEAKRAFLLPGIPE